MPYLKAKNWRISQNWCLVLAISRGIIKGALHPAGDCSDTPARLSSHLVSNSPAPGHQRHQAAASQVPTALRDPHRMHTTQVIQSNPKEPQSTTLAQFRNTHPATQRNRFCRENMSTLVSALCVPGVPLEVWSLFSPVSTPSSPVGI